MKEMIYSTDAKGRRLDMCEYCEFIEKNKLIEDINKESKLEIVRNVYYGGAIFDNSDRIFKINYCPMLSTI